MLIKAFEKPKLPRQMVAVDRRHAVRLAAPIIFFCLASTANAANLTICNESGKLVRIAAGVQNIFGTRSWGWTYIDPAECSGVAANFEGGFLSFRIQFVVEDTDGSESYRLYVPAEGYTAVDYCSVEDKHFHFQTTCESPGEMRTFYEKNFDTGVWTVEIR